MKATRPMASPKRLAAPEVEMDLDEQIALAEMAVIARDRRIRHRTDVLVARVKRDALRHAGGGLLMGVGTVALTWWLNRLSKRRAPPPAAAAATPPPDAAPTFEHLFRDAGLTLAGLLPVLWPMLPRAWRRLVTPGTASTLLTFVAPLLGRLLRRKGSRTGPA
jgi:hypothetical protein